MEVNTRDKVKFLQSTLLNWFSYFGRTFPWREDGLTDYQLIIAEALLQRTKAETVSKFYLSFLKVYPNWEALDNANIVELENTLRPLGLYSQRAKRLRSLGQEMVKRQGELPDNREELDMIPFFGQYIANSVELLIFKKSVPLLDVNMARVLERVFRKRKLADIRFDNFLQELSYLVVDIPQSKVLNWAILDFAALICKAKKPLCSECVLQSICNYYQDSLKYHN